MARRCSRGSRAPPLQHEDHLATHPAAESSCAHTEFERPGWTPVLDKLPHQVAKHASRLAGSYAVMEDVAGRFMAKHLAELPDEEDARLAFWLALMAKNCFVGLAGLDGTLQERLEKGRIVSDLKRKGLQSVQASR